MEQRGVPADEEAGRLVATDQGGLTTMTIFLSVPRALEAGVGGLWDPGDRVGNLGTLEEERRLSGT